MVECELVRATVRIVQSLQPRQSLCILAARMMHDWLTARGIESSVLPCRVLVWNDAIPEPESWSVGIGHGYPDARSAAFGYHTGRDSYNGHLVVRSGNLILDPTLGQASDPARKICAGPLVARVQGEQFFTGVARFSDVFRWGLQPSLRITYAAEPADLSYRRTPDWNCAPRAEFGALLDR